MLELPKEIVIFDTEYTTWPGAWERGWDRPGEHRELVQIGALVADTATLVETSTLLLFIKPKINVVLSDYFVELTGVTQEEVDREGTDLQTGLTAFLKWGAGRQMYSYGDDSSVMRENCALIGLECPFPDHVFFDVRDIFKRGNIPADDYTSGTIVKAFGVDPEHRAHDALSDSRIILAGLRLLKERG